MFPWTGEVSRGNLAPCHGVALKSNLLRDDIGEPQLGKWAIACPWSDVL